MKIQIIATLLAVVLLVESSAGFGLLSGLGQYGNPLFGGAGCGYPCAPPQMYGLAFAKMSPMSCHSCCKPCLLTKLLLLKKKIMEKKMSLMGCGCGFGCKPLCCGMM
ncbi:hypothetical protein RUM44_013907 [Polyplax serrata]|uniref:Uncharacterized protein n=2 Tax=Polyplax serrata TaxID=468196 RepID=A0ABR1BHD0_POLSC